eukprot:m.75378 g.75378  ORF g.75378 m.75378 type:complete len:108 (+) comp8480_c1_seq1:3-326(+)
MFTSKKSYGVSSILPNFLRRSFQSSYFLVTAIDASLHHSWCQLFKRSIYALVNILKCRVRCVLGCNFLLNTRQNGFNGLQGTMVWWSKHHLVPMLLCFLYDNPWGFF